MSNNFVNINIDCVYCGQFANELKIFLSHDPLSDFQQEIRKSSELVYCSKCNKRMLADIEFIPKVQVLKIEDPS